MEQNAQQGVPIEIIIKIKPEPQQRTDLRIYENKISLLDQYDRAVDEFITNGAILESNDSIRNTFESTIGKYLGFVVHGVNLSIFTFGSKGSGKSFALQGNQNESGLLPLMVETLFSNLESKRVAIQEEMQKLNVPEMEATGFTFSVRMKYVEIRDEGVIDLLQRRNYYKQPAQLTYTEYDGYTVNGAAWVALTDSMAFPDLIAEGEKFKTPYEYNKVTKNTSILTIEITQTLDNRATRDVKVITSRINVFDLPSADILADHFRNLSNSMEYKSIYAFQNMIGDMAKSGGNSIPTIYENSALTKLMKEYIGGNSLCVGLFTLQNNNFTISSITFKMMKLCSRIQNFPILNDVNAICLLKKFRTDISFYSKFKTGAGYELRPPIISQTQNENAFQKTQPIQAPAGDAAGRVAFLEKENARLEQALRDSEEEKQRLLNTIAQMRQQRADPQFNPVNQMGGMPPFMGDKYDVSDKLLHIEDDINEVNEIMNHVNKLNEKFKVLEDERKALAEEVENLRATNTNLTNELNRVNQEANSTKTNMDNELFNMKELLNSTKNELDYMRNEAEKYRKIQADLLLEIDEREVQYKKQLEDKEREIEMKMVEINQTEKRRLEGEMREATRKLEQYGEECNEAKKVIEELKKENNMLNLQNNEMRNTMKDFLNKDKPKGGEGEDNEPNEAKSKLQRIKIFTDRENELMEKLGVEKAKTENLKEKLKKMRTYARKARNMALDYFPPNEELPEMLVKDLNTYFEDAENESVIQFLEYEIRSLRERNKRLEYENNRLKEDYNAGATTLGAPKTQNPLNLNKTLNQTLNQNSTLNTGFPPEQKLSEKEIQLKILEEINKLKNSNFTPGVTARQPVVGTKPNTTVNPEAAKELERLRNENMKLNEENKRLKTMINESSVNDISTTNDTDNPKAMKMKINFLEKSIELLEKERSELNTRCTMAEEQLKNFQEMFNTTTQGYQKKILELNKRLEAANLRLSQNYNNANLDDI